MATGSADDLYIVNDGNKTATGNMDIDGFMDRTGGGTPVFVDGGFSHTFAGDWLLDQTYTSMTGTMTFDGTDQTIDESNFYNVIFAGSGTKTIEGDLVIDNDLTINTGVTVDAETEADIDINIAGNWSNVDGVFIQDDGTTTFDHTKPFYWV